MPSREFKQWDESAFCRRGRAIVERAAKANVASATTTTTTTTWQSPYALDRDSVRIAGAGVTARVTTALYPDISFDLAAVVHEDGVARVRMDERDGLRKRYDGTAAWALEKEPVASSIVTWVQGETDLRASYGDDNNNELRIEYQPLRVVLLRNGIEEVVINGQGLLHMEHFRNKPEVVAEETPDQPKPPPRPSAWFEGEEEDGYWEETFQSWTDSKPKGPDFPTSSHLYGIPQHATRLALPATTGRNPTFKAPYRLYNLDTFGYESSSPLGLYGTIPLLHAHSANGTVAVLNLVASDTWVDIHYPTPSSASSFWMSESGILDVLLLPGPTPERVFTQYAGLTGTTPLPAAWALGYHQCRWNYESSADIRSVQQRMDEASLPFDVLWLDIEYSHEHKYMVWEGKNFPDPLEMIADVEKNERRMVVIIDPHFKRDATYPVFQDASELGLLVKTPDGEEYDGHCWPGSSSWIDFSNPAAREYWARLFKIDPKDVPQGKWHWRETSAKLGIWNDMNEPAVFGAPEKTMPKDLLHHGGWEHRDVHNLYGMQYHSATAAALRHRTATDQRPFVLSRSFFAGSQRHGAIWTGDNLATWSHLTVGLPMLLTNNIAGMMFCGADVGGFDGNPPPDMQVRWYQAGAFMPFFRGHACENTLRREPYLLNDPHKSIVRNVMRLRYSLLPVWYTAFHTASTRGLPILRPQYVAFPQDSNGFAIDDQFWLGGSGLLVRPVTTQNTKKAQVYLSDDQPYYNYFTHAIYRGAGAHVTVAADLHQVPLFIHGGSIVPTREQPRSASPLMKRDPFTLTVALDRNGAAAGELYLDDGESYDFQNGAFVHREFSFTDGKLSSTNLRDASGSQFNAYAESIAEVYVEKIVILGLPLRPKTVKLGADVLAFAWKGGFRANGTRTGAASKLVINFKEPKIRIAQDWIIAFELPEASQDVQVAKDSGHC
ncbi:alpha-glucosidase [Auriculariales sp. MPI-PUGE-AT-0066]|nr:alpha-glucosidase [Auriculariales sp. MPI-PUGE-AT-0066]